MSDASPKTDTLPHPPADAAPAANPVLVEVTRGPAVESRHRGAVAVMNVAGEMLESWGDVEAPVYPRSAIKLLQALPLLETGAADKFKISAEEMALACASHGGGEWHLKVAKQWMSRLGLAEEMLACGPHAPLDPAAAAALARAGARPTRLHNNCSGKHLGMLTTAKFLEAPLESYAAPDHPVQARIQAVLAEMTGEDIAAAPVGTDGCGVPTIALPLRGLARAMARVARPDDLPLVRASSIRRLRVAVNLHPELAGAPGRLSTELLRRKRQALYAKEGAEGVWAAALPDYGVGIAIKIDDGASRAGEAAILALLQGLDLLTETDREALERFAPATLRNHAGAAVGRIRPAKGWLG